jgi:hypothetical protein
MIGKASIATLLTLVSLSGVTMAAQVKPGDEITPENAATVRDLVSPGNYKLVQQGMRMKIVPSQRIEWPPPYKTATEKYSAQVTLAPEGALQNYTAGQPFPGIDANDPQAATKVMWNFSFRPQYTDDVDLRFVEVASYGPGTGAKEPIAHFQIGHFAFYNNIGRTEVPPIPTDPEGPGVGIRYRFGAYPFLEPSELRGVGFVRYRHTDPKVEDNTWLYNPTSRTKHRVSATVLSDSFATVAASGKTYATTLDPDSYFGFSAKIEDYNYKLLGLRPMLACVHAENSPAKPCPFDGSRTVCPEAWEMRQLFVVEATAKPRSWSQHIGSDDTSIPKRVLYIDSEGWFITASDQYDRSGQLWKTIATFHTYRDRPVPDAKIAIYPYKRVFQTALVDENVQNGFSTVVYTPGRETPERECWYINMGSVGKNFFEPNQMAKVGH